MNVGRAHAFTFRIEEEQDVWEATAFRRGVFKRLAHAIAAWAERHGDSALADEAARLADGAAGLRIEPEHAWVVYKNAFNPHAGDERPYEPDRARELLHRALVVRPGWQVDTAAAARMSAWAVEGVERLNRQVMTDQGFDPEATLGSKMTAIATERLFIAQEALRRAWSAAAHNIERLVQAIVWISAPRQESSTDPATFGAIYLNPKPDWTVPRFAEVLLHEAGHLGLHIKSLLDPLLVNAEERSESAFRPDQRPMKGNLHAAFVLARMIHGLERYADSSEALPDKDEAAIVVRRDLWPRYVNAIRILEQHAEFTPAGEQLFASLHDGYKELHGVLGEASAAPSPREVDA